MLLVLTSPARASEFLFLIKIFGSIRIYFQFCNNAKTSKIPLLFSFVEQDQNLNINNILVDYHSFTVNHHSLLKKLFSAIITWKLKEHNINTHKERNLGTLCKLDQIIREAKLLQIITFSANKINSLPLI